MSEKHDVWIDEACLHLKKGGVTLKINKGRIRIGTICSRAKIALVSSVLSAFITGCMSLEERLASNDPAIKRTAEIELVRDAFREGNKQQRLAAVERVTYPEILVAIARSGKEDTKEEGLKAVAKIQEKNNLAVVAKNTRVKEIGIAACQKIVDQLLCIELAQNAALGDVRKVAYEKIQDQGKLLSIAQSSRDRAIKLAAMKRVIDKEKLLPIAFASVTPVRENRGESKVNSATDKITAMKMADAKKGPSMSKVVDSHINETASSVDVGLVNAFIENCANDDVFIRMIDAYGGKLSSKHCAILKTKTKNKTIQSHIDSIADIKIANRIKSSLNEDWTGSKFINADNFYLLFKEIGNEDIKESVFLDTVEYINRNGYNESWNSIVDCVKVNTLIKCINAKKDNLKIWGLIKDIACCVKGDDALTFFGAILPLFKVEEDSGYVDDRSRFFEGFMKNINKKDFQKYISILPIKTHKRWLSEVYELMNTPEDAKAFLEKGFHNATSNMKLQSVIMLSKEEKRKILAAAKERFEKNKDKISIGPFYLEMPYCDAIIIAESRGYFADAERPLAWFWPYLDGKNQGEVLNNKVCEIRLSREAALQFLECEDAHVLQQAIKQCVKKEKGRANSWDYASEIKTDFSMDSSARIDLFSPTGTTTEYESKMVSVYSNTKKGVKITYDNKTCELRICKY